MSLILVVIPQGTSFMSYSLSYEEKSAHAGQESDAETVGEIGFQSSKGPFFPSVEGKSWDK